MGNAIVTVFGYCPIRSKFTPYYMSKNYKVGNAILKRRTIHPFDEEKLLYNFEQVCNADKLAEEKTIQKTGTKTRRTKKMKKEEAEQLREEIRRYMMKFYEKWDYELLYHYARHRNIKTEYEALKDMKDQYVYESNKNELCSRALVQAIKRYEEDLLPILETKKGGK